MSKKITLKELLIALGVRIFGMHRGILLLLGKKRVGKLFQLHSDNRCNLCFSLFLLFGCAGKKIQEGGRGRNGRGKSETL